MLIIGGKMNKLLIEMLHCPKCHSKLKYVIEDENEIEINTGMAICEKCKKKYDIDDGIINFVERENEKSVSISDRLVTFLEDNPQIAEDLMNTDTSEMNASDTWAKYLYTKKKGNEVESEILSNQVTDKMYSKESIIAVSDLISELNDIIKDIKSPILDIASGYCNLGFEVLKNTDCSLVATDNNIHCIKESKILAEKLGYNSNRINFVVCDLENSPFISGGFANAITFVGLQNVTNPQKIVEELSRVVSNRIISISTFCKNEDKVNLFVLRRDKLLDAWIKEKYCEMFRKCEWDVTSKKSIIASVNGTSYGNIIKWIKVDRFPLKDTKFEYSIMISKRK